MSWNYRIVRCAIQVDQRATDEEFYYVLCEVHYDENGTPNGRSASGATFQASEGDGPGAIADALNLAYRDAIRRPVLDEWDIRSLEHLAPAET